MPRYSDELEAVLACEQALRRRIAERIAEEGGAPLGGGLSPEHVAAADAAIASWQNEGEEMQDLAAFRPMGPLQGCWRSTAPSWSGSTTCATAGCLESHGRFAPAAFREPLLPMMRREPPGELKSKA
ncbi:hypothetical protein [Bosea sp. (in: a-proteobacteria)]